MHPARLIGIAPLVAAALLVAGCGGGGGSTTSTSDTTTSGTKSASDWADGVCNSLSSWISTLKPIAQDLQSNPTKDSLKTAGENVKDANSQLVDDLEGLGKPDLPRGEAAKDVIEDLAGQLRTDSDQISSALSDISGVSGLVAAATSLSSTLVSMGNQIEQSLNKLESIDKDQNGSLSEAFKDSSDCQSLVKSNS
jgi:hypothetical protein